MTREVISVESRIEQVTVYAAGARVRRVATLRAPLPGLVRFAGLPLAVIDNTVRSEVDGAARVSSLRVGVDVPTGEPRGEESEELRGARQRVTLAESDVERLRAALGKLGEARLIIKNDAKDEPPAAWQAIVGARRELVGLRARREATLREQLAGARRDLDDAQRAFDVVIEREQRASTEHAARLHELRKYAELELSGEAGEIVVRVEYQIAAARWAPSYVARLGEPATARLEMRAVVAQQSGEDWTNVALRLSTAEPERFTHLPELHPQKLGRRQVEPAPRGFRPPPAGVGALYADYDRGFPRRAEPFGAAAVFDDSTYEGRAPEAAEAPLDVLGLAGEVWDEDSSRAKEMYRAAPAAKKKKTAMVTLSAPSAFVPPARMAGAAPGGMVRQPAMPPLAPTPRLDYGNLMMAPPTSRERGTLVPVPPALDAELAARVATDLAAVEQLPLPPGHVGHWAHTYDYAFASDGTVDLASDGAWHSIALTAREAPVQLRHVAVPREQADVFRLAAFANPFEGPLLPGPIDVYDRGQFLVTSEIDHTPPGGSVDVGLGVDPAVKIARNAEFHEEAAGMLRGGLRLVHAIVIDVENLAARPVELEVRERVPVTREGDDDVEVAVGRVEPAWERYAPDADAPRDARLRGGYRWRIALAPAAKQRLRAGYEVRISGKHELVGGNRRES